MFREMRRRKQQLPDDEAIAVLAAQKRGVLSVHGEDGYPYGIPVDYYFDVAERRVYIHCAKEGHKIDAIAADPRVCFTVWDDGQTDEDDGWSQHVRSVVAFGRASVVEDDDVVYRNVRALGLKYYPSEEEVDEEIRKALSRVRIIAVSLDHVTGKRVHEK